MQKLSLICISTLSTLTGLTGLVDAKESAAAFHNEAEFIAQHGNKAVQVAPSVYEVTGRPGQTIRYAFGESGRKYDAIRAKQLLEELEIGRQGGTAQEKALATALHAQVSSAASSADTFSLSVIKEESDCIRGADLGAAILTEKYFGHALAYADIAWDGFGPPIPDTKVWTLSAWSIWTKGRSVLWSDTPPNVILKGPAGGRIFSLATGSNGYGGCSVTSFASVSTNACPGSTSYRSVTQTWTCVFGP